MRLISQDGMLDIPYERVALGITMDNKIVWYNEIIAEYSSREKAYKVMEMLREQYEELEVFKVLACGTTEYMEKSLNYEELVKYIKSYREMNVFQFPKDDEVEVC